MSYGKIPALVDIDIELFQGEAVGLLGANGAGKTTLLNTLSGFLRPTAGAVELFGNTIDRCQPHDIVRRGPVASIAGTRLVWRPDCAG